MSNTKTKKANFSFENYIIKKADLMFTGEPVNEEITFGFAPSGKLYRQDRKFVLSLGVQVFDENKSFMITINTDAFFSYEEGIDEETLSNYMFKNAPAIIFPYVRAYISNITALSGIPIVILPTLNMSGLKEDLKQSMEYLD